MALGEAMDLLTDRLCDDDDEDNDDDDDADEDDIGWLGIFYHTSGSNSSGERYYSFFLGGRIAQSV